MSPSDTAMALVGALSGGFFVKLLDRHYHLKEKGMDVDATLRSELHNRVVELMAEVKDLECQLRAWKDAYYAAIRQIGILQAMYRALRLKIEELSGKPEPAPPEETAVPTLPAPPQKS